MQSADQPVSHSVLKDNSTSEEICVFMIIKARLQCLPTKYNLATWYPSKHDPFSILHTNYQENETVAHILNGCHYYKGQYMARHDRLVDLVVKDLQTVNQGNDR